MAQPDLEDMRKKLTPIIEQGVKELFKNVDTKKINSPEALERFIFQSGENEAVIKALFERTQKEAAKVGVTLNHYDADESLDDSHDYKIFDQILLEVIRNLSNKNVKSLAKPIIKPIEKPIEKPVLAEEHKVQHSEGPIPRVHKISVPADSPLLAYLRAGPLVASIKEKENRAIKTRFRHYGIITGLAILGAVLGGGIAIAVAGLTWPVLVAAALSAVAFGGARALYVHVSKPKESASANSGADLSSQGSTPAQEASSIATKVSIDNSTNPSVSTSIQSDLSDPTTTKSASTSTKLGK